MIHLCFISFYVRLRSNYFPSFWRFRKHYHLLISSGVIPFAVSKFRRRQAKKKIKVMLSTPYLSPPWNRTIAKIENKRKTPQNSPWTSRRRRWNDEDTTHTQTQDTTGDLEIRFTSSSMVATKSALKEDSWRVLYVGDIKEREREKKAPLSDTLCCRKKRQQRLSKHDRPTASVKEVGRLSPTDWSKRRCRHRPEPMVFPHRH